MWVWGTDVAQEQQREFLLPELSPSQSRLSEPVVCRQQPSKSTSEKCFLNLSVVRSAQCMLPPGWLTETFLWCSLSSTCSHLWYSLSSVMLPCEWLSCEKIFISLWLSVKKAFQNFRKLHEDSWYCYCKSISSLCNNFCVLPTLAPSCHGYALHPQTMLCGYIYSQHSDRWPVKTNSNLDHIYVY